MADDVNEEGNYIYRAVSDVDELALLFLVEFSKGRMGLRNARSLLFSFHKYKPWETGQKARCRDFVAYVEKPKTEGGLGTTVKELCTFFKDDAEALAYITRMANPGPGNPTGTNQHTCKGISDNITNSKRETHTTPASNRGTGKLAGLIRLEKEAETDPKAEALKKKVKAGQLSVHAALVELGIRKKYASVQVDRQAVLDWINRTFDDDDCLWISDELTRSPR